PRSTRLPYTTLFRSPFSWGEPQQIGWKAAPAFSIFHLMFQRAGRPEREMEELVDGFCHMFAAIQMQDDLSDVSANIWQKPSTSSDRKSTRLNSSHRT